MTQAGNMGGMAEAFSLMGQGMGLMGQAAMEKFMATRQNISNLLDTTPQKVTQVAQQRQSYSGGGGGAYMQNPNAMMLQQLEAGPGSFGPNVPGGPPPTGPGGGYVGPSPTGGGNNPPPPSDGGKGNKGGGGKKPPGGGGPGGPGGKTPVGGMNFSRGSMLGGATNVVGMAAPVMMGVGNITEGKTLEGVGNISGGAAALAATRGMNPLIRLGAAGLGAIGFGGLGAAGDRALASKTGQGSEAYNQEKQRYQTGQNMSTFMQGMNELQRTQLQNDILRMQAMEPVVNRMQDKMLVRQQAMNASLTNSYAMLGTLATAGKMAQQSQREAGANFRTALTANPYAASAVAAPSISF